MTLLAAGLWTLLTAQDADEFASKVRPVLERHCGECHGEEVRKRNLRVDTLAPDVGNPETFATWLRIYDRIALGEMPPKRSPRAAEELRPVLDWLRGRLHRESLARREGRGRALLRRLNRVEYENTLRDLLGLPCLEVQSLLPEDGRSVGFTKVGGALDLSHVQIEKYLEAAELALNEATATRPEPPRAATVRLFPANQGAIRNILAGGDAVFIKDKEYARDHWPLPWRSIRGDDAKRVYPFDGPVGILRHEDDAYQPRFSQFAAPAAGWYRVRVSVWSFVWDKDRVRPSPRTEAALLSVGSRALATVDAPSLESRVHEVDAWMDPGETVDCNPTSIPWIRVSEWPGHLGNFTGPGVAIDWLEIEGPFLQEWPPRGHRLLFGDLPLVPFPKGSDILAPKRTRRPRGRKFPQVPVPPDVWTVASVNPASDARRLLAAFLKRAFRRPVPPGEVDRYVAVVEDRLKARRSFEEALKTAYKVALSSPDFLFLHEEPGVLDDWALASRLSSFLWNSMPDDELYALAEKGRLRDPKVLRAQAERMLAGPQGERFVAGFTDQWLDLRDIDATCPDRKLYPEFTPYLRASMLEEARATFREMIQQDRPVLEVVRSDWSMLNQYLAEFYGVPDVTGSAFRKVALPPDSPRGGFLTQAAILKVTANGTVTSPVKRGAWVLDKIFNRPPDPPPPGTPAVDPDIRGATTIREQLAKHRSEPSCAGCHVRIDPAGFALESFDVIGSWRTRYRSLGQGDPPTALGRRRRPAEYRLALPVESSGVLPDGRPFDDVGAFKRLMADSREAILRGVAEKLIVYATGAVPDFADRAAVDEILIRVGGKGSGMRTLVMEIVSSPIFTTK